MPFEAMIALPHWLTWSAPVVTTAALPPPHPAVEEGTMWRLGQDGAETAGIWIDVVSDCACAETWMMAGESEARSPTVRQNRIVRSGRRGLHWPYISR